MTIEEIDITQDGTYILRIQSPRVVVSDIHQYGLKKIAYCKHELILSTKECTVEQRNMGPFHAVKIVVKGSAFYHPKHGERRIKAVTKFVRAASGTGTDVCTWKRKRPRL